MIWQALDNLGDSRTAAVGTIGNREWKRSAIRKIMFKNQSHLKNSNVSVISFSGLYGNNADFSGSDFNHSRLSNWQIDEANVSHCTLVDAQFENSWLPHAKFVESDLYSASFTASDLFEADFSGSINLEGGRLSGTNLKGAKGLAEQIMGQAINAGAVLMDTNEFNRWQKNKLIPSDMGERQRCQHDGFKIDSSGQPMFVDQTYPTHGFNRVGQ